MVARTSAGTDHPVRQAPRPGLSIVRVHEPDARRAAEALLILLSTPPKPDEREAPQPAA